MRWEIRDDIISLDTFVVARVHYDRFLRIIYDAGGYAFTRQIDELWKQYGGRNLAKKMIDAKLLKSESFSPATYVYLTEAALKYLKYSNSSKNFDAVAKKTLSVDTLSGSPSHKVLLASALKFTLIAPNADGKTTNNAFIGRTEYKKQIEKTARDFARWIYPDFESVVPEKDIVGNLMRTDYEIYPEVVDQIINTCWGFYNSAKITIVPWLEKSKYDNKFVMNAEVYIFDCGIEKKARDYIRNCLEFIQKTSTWTSRIFHIHCFSYFEGRQQNIRRDFETFLKNPRNIKKLKDTYYYITDVKFELGVFQSDPLLEQIIGGKVISLPKRKIVKIDTVCQEERTKKAIENSRAKLGKV